MVKRFALGEGWIEEDEGGDYVLYSDYEALKEILVMAKRELQGYRDEILETGCDPSAVETVLKKIDGVLAGGKS